MSHYLQYLAICVAAAAGANWPAASQEIGDAEMGHIFAREVCASCHGIEKGDQTSPEPFAPTFEIIATTPGMTPTALSIFLRTPHSTMPNLVLSDDELGNVIAYIMTLKE